MEILSINTSNSDGPISRNAIIAKPNGTTINRPMIAKTRRLLIFAFVKRSKGAANNQNAAASKIAKNLTFFKF